METASIPRKMAYARLGYAAAALFAPKLATVAIGAKPGEMTPAAMGWAGVFASREAALGVLSLGSEDVDPVARRKVLLLNAAVDAVDVLTILLLVRRQRSIMPLFVALPAGVASIVGHLLAAQELRSVPDISGAVFENASVTA